MRHLKDDPADLALATELSQKLLLLAPEAELPRLPGEERRPRPRRAGARRRLPAADPAHAGGAPGRARARADGGAAASRVRRTTLSKRQTQLAVGLGSGAVLLVVIVLARRRSVQRRRRDGLRARQQHHERRAPAPGAFRCPTSSVDKSGDFQNAFAIRQALQPLLPQTQADLRDPGEGRRSS